MITQKFKDLLQNYKTSQMVSQIVPFEQTDFLFFPIKIQLEKTEIWPKVATQLATAILGDQLDASQMASQNVQNQQTNFFFYPIKIPLEMAEIQPKIASHSNSGRLAGGQLVNLSTNPILQTIRSSDLVPGNDRVLGF